MEEILNENVINETVMEDVAEEAIDNGTNGRKLAIGMVLSFVTGMVLYKVVKFTVNKIKAKNAEKKALESDESDEDDDEDVEETEDI